MVLLSPSLQHCSYRQIHNQLHPFYLHGCLGLELRASGLHSKHSHSLRHLLQPLGSNYDSNESVPSHPSILCEATHSRRNRGTPLTHLELNFWQGEVHRDSADIPILLRRQRQQRDFPLGSK